MVIHFVSNILQGQVSVAAGHREQKQTPYYTTVCPLSAKGVHYRCSWGGEMTQTGKCSLCEHED